MRIAVVALLMTALVSACGGAPDVRYPACIGALQYRGQTYTEIGFTDAKGTALEGSATYATCLAKHRKGAQAALRDAAETVTVRSLPGYAARDVVEVQVTDKAWNVLVSDAASAQLGREIRRAGLLNAGEQ